MTLTFHKTIKKKLKIKTTTLIDKLIQPKSDIKNKKDTQSQIDKLQNQIDQLKQNEETNADSKFTKFYQNQIDKLKMQITLNLITKIKVKLTTCLKTSIQNLIVLKLN